MKSNPPIIKIEHAPTLNTILMVEKALQQAEDSIVKVSELKRMLPKQINHNVLKTILEYLEQSHKIYVGIKGICWIQNDSPKMKEALRKSVRYPEDFPDLFKKDI